jgi:hypothetical protein
VRILDYHIVPGVAAKADDLSDGQKARESLRTMQPLLLHANDPGHARTTT